MLTCFQLLLFLSLKTAVHNEALVVTLQELCQSRITSALYRRGLGRDADSAESSSMFIKSKF